MHVPRGAATPPTISSTTGQAIAQIAAVARFPLRPGEGLRIGAIQRSRFDLVDTGVRVSELCNFKIKDYAQQQGRLFVREGKGDKDRVVFLGNAGRRILWRYLTTRPAAKQEDYLFPSKTNRRLDRNNLRETIQRVAERAGVSGVTIHRFRHTFAINFLRNGGSVLELQEMLGHEKMETVRIYRGWHSTLAHAAKFGSLGGGVTAPNLDQNQLLRRKPGQEEVGRMPNARAAATACRRLCTPSF